jgi:hypothetical protein
VLLLLLLLPLLLLPLLLPLLLQIWCVPVPKPGSHVPAVCQPETIRQQLQVVLALQVSGNARSCTRCDSLQLVFGGSGLDGL